MFAKELQQAGHVRKFSIIEGIAGWEVRDVQDFPRTPSGKVKKFALRAELRGHGPG